MKRILILFAATVIACGTVVREPGPVPAAPVPSVQKDILADFFSRCELDMDKAGHVVMQEDIIKNLTHLHRMDSGGRKYYILERDAISRMIHAVTQDIYSDFIIINDSGTIIFTAHNDYLFGKNIKRELRTSALASCADTGDGEIHIHDVTILDSNPPAYAILISKRLKGGNAFPGTFILQLDTEQIGRIFTKPTEIIGPDGKYRITSRERTLLPYPRQETVSLCRSLNAGESVNFRDNSTEYRCRDFRYRDLSWFVISRESF